MKFFIFLMFLSITSLSYGDVVIKEKNNGPSSYCDLTTVGLGFMALDESKTIDKTCVRVICKEKEIIYEGCGALYKGKGCTKTKPDYSKTYPHCCPQVICDENKL